MKRRLIIFGKISSVYLRKLKSVHMRRVKTANVLEKRMSAGDIDKDVMKAGLKTRRIVLYNFLK